MRSVYGVLIRTPIIGPLVRLPLRLLRWWLQPPDRDPSARTDRLAAEIEALHEQYGRLALAHNALCRDQERTRLILFMISGRLQSDMDERLNIQSAERLAEALGIDGDAADRTPARNSQASAA